MKKCKICTKLIIKPQKNVNGVFIANFEQISNFNKVSVVNFDQVNVDDVVLMSLLLTLDIIHASF